LCIYTAKYGNKVYADFWDPDIFDDQEFYESITIFNPNKGEFNGMFNLKDDSWTLKDVTHEFFLNTMKEKNLKSFKFCVKMGGEGSLYFDQDI